VFIDEWGIKWKTVVDDNVSFYKDGTIKTADDLEHFQPPCPQGRTSTLMKILKTYGDKLAVASGVSGPFNHAWLMTGFDVFVKALYMDQRASPLCGNC